MNVQPASLQEFTRLYKECFTDPLPDFTVTDNMFIFTHLHSWAIVEINGFSAHIYYAGTHPDSRDKGSATLGFPEVMEHLEKKGVQALFCNTRTENIVPQIILLKKGFMVAGMFQYPGTDYLQLVWRKIWKA